MCFFFFLIVQEGDLCFSLIVPYLPVCALREICVFTSPDYYHEEM